MTAPPNRACVKRRGAPKRERGTVLIMAMSFLVIMTLLGAMTLSTVTMDIQVAGAERSSEDALYIAEAGIEWGRQEIVEVYGGATVDLVTMLPDPLTPVIPNSDAVAKLRGWRELGTQIYGSGVFRVAVRDDDALEDGVSGNDTFLLRSLGTAAGGAQRMIEVTMKQ